MVHSRKKSYADQKVLDVDFMVGERVLLNVLLIKYMRIRMKGKLSSMFIGTFEDVQYDLGVVFAT